MPRNTRPYRHRARARAPTTRPVRTYLALDDADLRDERVQRTVEDFCWHALWFGDGALPVRGKRCGAPRRSGARRTSTRMGRRHYSTLLFYYWRVIVLVHSRTCRNGGCRKKRCIWAWLWMPTVAGTRQKLDDGCPVSSKATHHEISVRRQRQPPGSLDEGYDLARACLAYARHVAAADASIALEYVFWPRHRDALGQKLEKCPMMTLTNRSSVTP